MNPGLTRTLPALTFVTAAGLWESARYTRQVARSRFVRMFGEQGGK